MIMQLFYGGPSFETLHEKYAKNGRIDEKALVQSSTNAYINAPVERVWELLINLPNWPAIDFSFSDVQLEAGVNVDAHFSSKLNNFPIKEKFAVIKPCRELQLRIQHEKWLAAFKRAAKSGQ